MERKEHRKPARTEWIASLDNKEGTHFTFTQLDKILPYNAKLLDARYRMMEVDGPKLINASS